MPPRSIIILVLGIVIALGAAWSLHSRMAPSNVPQTQVLVAAADIPAGSFVRATYHLAFANWPQNNITDGMLTNATVKATDFEGAVARRAIQKGEPIQRTMLVKEDFQACRNHHVGWYWS